MSRRLHTGQYSSGSVSSGRAPEIASLGVESTRNHYNGERGFLFGAPVALRAVENFMLKRILPMALATTLCAGLCAGQYRRDDHPLRQAVRGTHGAVAAGSEYATEAGMRMYYHGGNAVDAGVATMFAASVTEFSHFGMGGEAPILIRTKAGKVYSIAGVGTMPKLATADMFRNASAAGRAKFSKPIRAD